MSKMPTYEEILLPLLTIAGDKKEHTLKESKDAVADHMKLTQEQREQTFSEDRKSILYNRLGWAKTYLSKAGLIESTGWGKFRISQAGLELLKQNPQTLDSKMLEKYDGFKEFKYGTNSDESLKEKVESSDDALANKTPEDLIELGYNNYNKKVTDDLLTTLEGVKPDQFEQIVVDLLVKMGYGGSRKEAGQVLGKSGDEGIDGVIKEDKLGLDAIYIQAKRWTGNTVGRPHIQQFVGALSGKKARKGVYITTSSYSKEAEEYVKHLEQKVILIDGQKLVELMLEYNLGVSIERVIEIKRIDSDYFNEE